MTPLEALVMMASGLAMGIGWVRRETWLHPIILGVFRFVRRNLPGARNHRLLEEILKEYKPNGGGSMRDALNRLEDRITRTQQYTKLILRMHRISDEYQGLATFVTDEEGRCTYANSHYLDIVGLTFEEMREYGWKNAMEAEEKERVWDQWLEAVEEQRDFHMAVNYRNYRTGKLMCCKVDAYVVKNEDGLIGWAGYVQPVERGDGRSGHSCPMARGSDNETY